MQGYTFIELIITLTIISLLTAWGMPNYRDFQMNNALVSERNRLLGTVHFARNQSIIRSQHVVICPSQNAHSCNAANQWHKGWIAFADEDLDRQRQPEELLLHAEGPMRSGISATSSIARSKIRYNREGYSPGTNATISVCDSRGNAFGKTLVISNVGRPRQSGSTNAQCRNN
ncbi:GspH/FimT family pseudopilin [Marinicella sp. W31]|uniref:GspH/FimT family pseudopilin n=1 Tax=Marinicella sp. W31 TaxID=3023713 RepID=UPI003756DDDF